MWPRCRVINLYPAWGRSRCGGLIREQNDHLFPQSRWGNSSSADWHRHVGTFFFLLVNLPLWTIALLESHDVTRGIRSRWWLFLVTAAEFLPAGSKKTVNVCCVNLDQPSSGTSPFHWKRWMNLMINRRRACMQSHTRQHTQTSWWWSLPGFCRPCAWHRGSGLKPHSSCVLCLVFTHSEWALWMAGTQRPSRHQGATLNPHWQWLLETNKKHCFHPVQPGGIFNSKR